MSEVVLVTGASSGIGALVVRALADHGCVVFAGIRELDGRNAPARDAALEYARAHGVELRPVELDVQDQTSVERAVDEVVTTAGRLDVLVHNAGHMTLGPAEAFSVDELTDVFDTNVLGTQRVNAAALPVMRAAGSGLLIWISSSSVKGGTPPYLGPYFAAKAAMDSLAVSYAAELARWGIGTTIVVPGAFTSGTNHFANAGTPRNAALVREYDRHYARLSQQVAERLAELAPADADVAEVARAVVDVVAAPESERPFRVHIDPAEDGSAEVSDLADAVRERFLRRIGLDDLLRSQNAQQ